MNIILEKALKNLGIATLIYIGLTILNHATSI